MDGLERMDTFEDADVEDLFVAAHYTPFANMLVAQHIHNYLINMSSQEN